MVLIERSDIEQLARTCLQQRTEEVAVEEPVVDRLLS
jgi:hypothetical protein